VPGKRRPRLAVEAGRRVAERLARVGGEIATMRRQRSWTQAELAERAGLGRMVVNRAERGVGPLDVDGLERLSIAFGVPINVGFARDPRVDVADAGHLAMQELVLRLGRRCGHTGGFELPTKPKEPWRSVDVVLAAEARHRMICVECWNTMGDIGASVRASTRKVAEVEALATGLWGAGVATGLVWVVRATARNRYLVARYPEVFASWFRGSSQGWVAALVNGAEPPKDPGLVWSDVAATRLFAWRRSG